VASHIEAGLELKLRRRCAKISPANWRLRDNISPGSGTFDTVRRAVGLEDLRFHDLRHTAATRLVGANIPLSEVGRVLGHTQANTTYRYVNANLETAKRAAAALDAFNAEPEAAQPVTESVN
jgi:integrase